MPIDDRNIPSLAFFDTSSLLDVLLGESGDFSGWNPQRKREARYARELFGKIIRAKGTVYSSSVALAEVLRGGSISSPQFGGLVFYPFDNECTRILASKFPANVSKITGSGEAKACVKFDTLIISTALRVAMRAPFVTADDNQLKRATDVGLTARKPFSFAAQQDLFELLDSADDEG